MWLGLQYYADFVYARARAAATVTGDASLLDGFVASRLGHALRLSASVAWLLGCGLLSTLSIPGHHGFADAFLLRRNYAPIGIGSWIGTIMLAITLGPMRTDDVSSCASLGPRKYGAVRSALVLHGVRLFASRNRRPVNKVRTRMYDDVSTYLEEAHPAPNPLL